MLEYEIVEDIWEPQIGDIIQVVKFIDNETPPTLKLGMIGFIERFDYEDEEFPIVVSFPSFCGLGDYIFNNEELKLIWRN